MHSIIDGDGLLFQAAYNVRNLKEAYRKMVDKIQWVTGADWDQTGAFTMYLEGKGNWRFDVFDGYKASRGKAKAADPNREIREELRAHLVEEKIAILAKGCESDDLVRRKADLMRARGQDYIVISADKDLDLTVGPHIRFTTRAELLQYDVSEQASDRNYYYQLLVGDMTDNIQHPNGIGPVKANKILDDATPQTWKRVVENAYKEKCGSEWLHALYFTGSLIHIQRFKDDFFNWGNRGTWWDMGFKGAPSCYNYTKRMLGVV